MKIFLIGMPGSGKSTIGTALAAKLNMPFVDLDHEIEKLEGRVIKDIFSESGEAYFRQVESAVLKQVALEVSEGIIATGGGAPCFHNGIDVINANGISLFLDVAVDELVARVENNKDRPLLHASDRDELRKRLEGIRATRLKVYEQAVITVNDSSVDTALTLLSPLLKNSQRK